uniref:Uncharacterized protein n=1 Tax=Rhizophora mucronata TaxID=61149 RepID=A0A2P2J234_RHIMU
MGFNLEQLATFLFLPAEHVLFTIRYLAFVHVIGLCDD